MTSSDKCNVPQSSFEQVNPYEPSHILECPVDAIDVLAPLSSPALSSDPTFVQNVIEFFTNLFAVM